MNSVTALQEQEIKTALAELHGWDFVERTPPGSGHAHAELHKLFVFASFADAMHFMVTASRFIHVSDHHPSWMNTYSRVEVWVTTGELKHKVSRKDVALARYLEDLFQQYKS